MNTVTPEMLKVCRAMRKRTGLSSAVIVRWSHEGGYELEVTDGANGGAVHGFRIEGTQEVHYGASGHTRLYANGWTIRPAIGIGNVCKAGDVIRACFVLGNGRSDTGNAGTLEDTCTLRIFRDNNFIVELCFDFRTTDVGTRSIGMRSYT
jgi:hypothetical protein